jgi:hypothetical protein
LIFPYAEKAWGDKIDDGEIKTDKQVKNDISTTVNEKYRDELINVRNK